MGAVGARRRNAGSLRDGVGVMGAPTQDDLDAIVREIEAKGMKVIYSDKWMHYGRMITIGIDEGDPDHVTVFEIWPEGLSAPDVAAQAAACRGYAGPGMVYEIGTNPITDDYVPAGWDTTISGKPAPN